MEKSIIINNNVIKLQAKYYGYHSDVSWDLDINEIKIIGAVNRMAGDNDSFFLVFIDHKMRPHIVNTTYLETGREELFTLLKAKFEINILHWEQSLEDKDVVLYPKEYEGKKLYDFNLIQFIKRITGFVHVASGRPATYLR
jgi:hypothetical protein